MTVHRSHKQRKTELVVTTTLKRQLRRKVWPVHRLDHRTSGALVLAFDAAQCAKLHDALRQGEKLYLALVRGNWQHHFPNQKQVTMQQPIQVKGLLKEATTIFECLAVHPGSSNNNCQEENNDDDEVVDLAFSLVTARLLTGRQHQIRRHAFHMGMPILGDTQHGSSRDNRWWRRNRQLHRLALHCLSLHLPSIGTNDNGENGVDIVAPLPEDFKGVLEQDALFDLWTTACQKEPRLTTPFIDIRTGTLGIEKDWQKQQRLLQTNDDDNDDGASLVE